MKKILCAMIIGATYACAPTQSETTSNDTTAVELDTATIADNEPAEGDEPVEDAEMYDADPGEVNGRWNGDEYEIFNTGGYITNPFSFTLDSATVQQLLGEEAVITSRSTPAGQDDMGAYDGYTFYEVKAGKTEMSFYSYSGKHYADVYTPKLEFNNGVVVGMTKAKFIEAMGLSQDTMEAKKFTINDDYGQMMFIFDGDLLANVYVSYEEGD